MDFTQPLGDFIVTQIKGSAKSPKEVVDYERTLTKITDEYQKEYDFFRIQDTPFLYCWNGIYFENKISSPLSASMEAEYKQRDLVYKNKDGDELIERLRRRTEISGDDTNSNDNIIPFTNGYFHIDKNELLLPEPFHKCTYCIPHDYNPEATSTLFIPALEKIIPDKQIREKLLIFMAYCLTSLVHLQKFLIIYGEGNNGKSLIVDTLRAIVGKKLVSKVPLQELGNQFNTGLYLGKLINIADDIPKHGMKDVSFLKQMAGSRSLHGQLKKVNGFDYKNITKSISTCNQIPNVPEDASDGFWRKAMIIPLFERFSDELGNRDAKLQDKILEEPEMEGIINILISYLPRLDELAPVDIEQNKEDWNKYGDSTKVFFVTHINNEAYGEKIRCNMLYKMFKQWVKINGLVPMTFKGFGSQLKEFGVTVSRLTCAEGLALFYTDIYPIFSQAELKAMDMKQDIFGKYHFVTPDDAIQAIIDAGEPEDENYEQSSNPQFVILEKIKEFQQEDSTEPITALDLYEPLSISHGLTLSSIKSALVNWHKDGTLYCPSNDHYKLSKKY